MNSWRLLHSPPSSAGYNMSVDEALLNLFYLKEKPILRFYTWKKPTLSLGYYQSIKDINIEKCREYGFDIVRRPTGGRAVLHDKELTYSIICRSKHSNLALLKDINTALCKGLEIIGIKASIYEKTKLNPNFIEKASCFASTSNYEIHCNGKKLAGSAQLKRGDIILQHGSILFSIDFEKLYSIFLFSDEKKRQDAINHAKESIISINEIIENSIKMKDIMGCLKKGFEEYLDIDFFSCILSEDEKRNAKILDLEKYSNNNWTFRR